MEKTIQELIVESAELLFKNQYDDSISSLNEAWYLLQNNQPYDIQKACNIQYWLGQCYLEKALQTSDEAQTQSWFNEAIEHHEEQLRLANQLTDEQTHLVSEQQWRDFETKRENIEREIQRLKSTWYTPLKLPESEQERVFGQKLAREANLHDLLRRPNLDYAKLMTLPNALPEQPLPESVIEQVEIQVKYQGYIDRQNEEIDTRRDMETLRLPEHIDYAKVKGLSAEVQQKLNKQKPETVGQASRISGVTPTAVALLMVHLKRGFKDAK